MKVVLAFIAATWAIEFPLILFMFATWRWPTAKIFSATFAAIYISAVLIAFNLFAQQFAGAVFVSIIALPLTLLIFRNGLRAYVKRRASDLPDEQPPGEP